MQLPLLASAVLAAAAASEPPSASASSNLIVSPTFPSCSGCGSNSCGYTNTVPGQFNNNAVAPIAFTPPGGIATSIDVPAPRRRVTVSFSTRSSRDASGCAAFYPNLTVKVSGGVADHSFEISENTIAWTQKSFTFKPKTDGIFVIAFTTSPQASIGCAPTIYNVQAYQDRE